MGMKHAVIGAFLNLSLLAHAEVEPTQNTSPEATRKLRSMVDKAFFSRADIDANSTTEAIQQLCDLIGEKQSVKDEKAIHFVLSNTPNIPFDWSFSTERKSGPQLLDAFCKELNLTYQFDQGAIYLFPNTSLPVYKEAREKLEAIPVESVSIGFSFLPHALREVLTPHGLSFSILHPAKADPTKPNPILLDNYRINSYKKQQSNLLEILSELAQKSDNQLWISPQHILFTPKGIKLETSIRSSRVKKPSL